MSLKIRTTVNSADHKMNDFAGQDYVLITSICALGLIALAIFFANAALQLLNKAILPEDQTAGIVFGIAACFLALCGALFTVLTFRAFRRR